MRGLGVAAFLGVSAVEGRVEEEGAREAAGAVEAGGAREKRPMMLGRVGEGGGGENENENRSEEVVVDISGERIAVRGVHSCTSSARGGRARARALRVSRRRGQGSAHRGAPSSLSSPAGRAAATCEVRCGRA